MVATDYKLRAIQERQTKEQLIGSIAEDTEVPAKHVRAVLASLADHARRHLVAHGSGEFVVPDLGIKLKRTIKGASKTRVGRNPSTGEQMTIPGKPERPMIRATVLKNLSEVVEGAGGRSSATTAEQTSDGGQGPTTLDLLIGKWQSDADATRKEAEKSPALTGEMRQSLGNLFGKLIATYTTSTFTTEYNGEIKTYQYQATGAGMNYVDIDYFNPEKAWMERKRIFVQGNQLWIELPEFGFREIFRRMT